MMPICATWTTRPKLDAAEIYVGAHDGAYGDIYARALKVPSRTKEILKPEERFSLHREATCPCLLLYFLYSMYHEYESFYFPEKKGIF